MSLSNYQKSHRGEHTLMKLLNMHVCTTQVGSFKNDLNYDYKRDQDASEKIIKYFSPKIHEICL